MPPSESALVHPPVEDVARHVSHTAGKTGGVAVFKRTKSLSLLQASTILT